MKNARLRLTALAVPALLAASSGAQDVLVVDANGGPGTDFTAIQPAVDAAASGDLVLVRPGTYGESVLVDGKGIGLQADVGGPVVIDDLTVTGIPAGTHFAARGLDLAALGHLEVAECTGPVWIEDLDSPPPSAGGAVAFIVACDDVVVRGCRLAGIHLLEAGLTVRDSRLLLIDADLTGGDGVPIPNWAVPGAPGLEIQGSTVFAASCRFVGGDGAPPEFTGAGDGGWAVTLVTASHLEVLDVTTIPGFDGEGLVQQVPYYVSANSHVRERPIAARAMTLPSPLREGETTTMTFQGVPGDVVTLTVAGEPAPLADLPGRIGPRAVGAPQFVFPMGIVPASGLLEVPFTAPEIPGERHLYFLQAGFVEGRGGIKRSLVHGAPTLVRILDTAY
jgi:hypothetical protein